MNQFRLRGALDVANVRELHAFACDVASNAAGDVELDATEVERIDAAGAQVVLALREALRTRGFRLVLRSVPEGVAALLARTGLSALTEVDHA